MTPTPSHSTTYTPHTVLPLTSLRFFAAFYVVLYHTLPFVFSSAEDATTAHGRILSLGYTSVSFFFLLSGYILTVSYLQRSTSKARFWNARFARVYPLYFLTLLLDIPHYAVFLKKSLGMLGAAQVVSERLIENALLLQAWIPRFRSLDWPNWSLSVEALFYFLCPFLLLVIKRLGLLALIITGLVTYAAGLLLVVGAIHTTLSLDALKFEPWLHLHTFVCGALLGASRFKFHIPSSAGVALFGIAVAGFATTIYYSPRIPMPLIHDGLLVPVFCCLVIAFDCKNRWLDRLLSHHWLVLLGEASYALYLLHIPLWHVVFRLKLDHSLAVYPFFIIATLAASIVSFKYVENPLRNAIASRKRAHLEPAVR